MPLVLCHAARCYSPSTHAAYAAIVSDTSSATFRHSVGLQADCRLWRQRRAAQRRAGEQA